MLQEYTNAKIYKISNNGTGYSSTTVLRRNGRAREIKNLGVKVLEYMTSTNLKNSIVWCIGSGVGDDLRLQNTFEC
jgi:hypothetical protein